MDAELIAAQFSHAVDLIKAEQRRLSETSTLRLDALEYQVRDYETRLRDLRDSSTQFKLLVGLATGGGLLGAISLLKALLLP